MIRPVQEPPLPDGRETIHWFMRDESGPAQTPGGAVPTNQGPQAFPAGYNGVRGKIACRPNLSHVTPKSAGGRPHIIQRSDDPRAVTCPKCMETKEFVRAMMELNGELTPEAATRG